MSRLRNLDRAISANYVGRESIKSSSRAHGSTGNVIRAFDRGESVKPRRLHDGGVFEELNRFSIDRGIDVLAGGNRATLSSNSVTFYDRRGRVHYERERSR